MTTQTYFNTVDNAHISARRAQQLEGKTKLSTVVSEFIQVEVGQSVEEISKKPVLNVPEKVDDDYPLTHYLISSSHNTYLLSRQLVGKSSAAAYTNVILRGCACVEIDLWHSSKGLRVTHGYTLSSSVGFEEVCNAIADGARILDKRFDSEGGFWPVLISLENHVPVENQPEVIDIMKRTMGQWLVLGKLDNIDDAKLTPRDFRGRIVVMVEYYPTSVPSELQAGSDLERTPSFSSSSSSSSSSSDSSVSLSDRLWPGSKKKKPPHPKISEALATLGYYCRSMKPKKDWWGQFVEEPKHILINISESTIQPLLSLEPGTPLPTNATQASTELQKSFEEMSLSSSAPSYQHLTPLQNHSLSFLRRVYPKGTRITSSNMLSTRFWRSGSQVVGLNWQKFDRGMECGGALFVNGEEGAEEEEEDGSVEPEERGYVLKPSWLRGEEDNRRKRRIRVEMVGVSALPPPEKHEAKSEGKPGKEFGVYLKAEIYCARSNASAAHAHSTGGNAATSAAEQSTVESRDSKEEKEIKQSDEGPDQILSFRSPTVRTRELAPERGCDFDWGSSEDEKRPLVWEWEYLEDELAFVRLAFYRDERWGRDDLLGVFCARTSYLVENDWRMVRLMDAEGRNQGGTVLARFTFETL